LFFGELGVEGVDGDVDGAAVGLEGEDALHDVGGGLPEGGAEVVEVFEVGFVDGVADDFDVEVVEVVGGEAVAEVGCYMYNSIEDRVSGQEVVERALEAHRGESRLARSGRALRR
jgi:hypothetical protein